MSLDRPSKSETTAPAEQPAPTKAKDHANSKPVSTNPEPRAAARPTAAAARLEEGTKRILLDVVPAEPRQVKVRAVDYSGGIKEYILRLLEADGIDLSDQPDFVPRPKGDGKGRRTG